MNFTVPTPIVNNGAPVVGGYINFNPGAGVNDAAGGYFVVFAGTGGNSAAGLGVGGGVSLIGGDGGGGGDNPGGGMLISAGAGQANGIGGTVQIFGGLNGGSIEIAAGVAGPPQVGGSITLSPGVGTGTDDGNVYIGAAASTSDTRNGNFVYLPTSTGTPTGTPVANPGLASAVIDTTNERIYVLVGGVWKFAQLV